MDTGLTAISETDIEKHRAMAQSFITRVIVMEDSSGRSATELAGTGRRFVSTVSTGSVRRTREVELSRTVASIRPDDQLLSIPQHTLLYRARRGLAVAMATADVFAKSTALEDLQGKNARSPLEGEDVASYKRLLSAAAYVSAFTFASYLLQTIDSDAEAPSDVAEPDYVFDTQQDALKALIAGLDGRVRSRRACTGIRDNGTRRAVAAQEPL
jgi:hypothetical protein